jgi:DNA-binding transcriptional LysR family regulator
MQPTDRIARRLKPRDLHVLMVVAEEGSMAKAADRLAVSRPVVSKVIASLEATLSVRLLDRVADGVSPTPYGAALIRHGQAMFDALRQGVEEIAFLSDPGGGLLRIGCSEIAAAGIVAAAVDQLSQRHPRAHFELEQGTPDNGLKLLRERRVDLVVSRIPEAGPDIALEPLLCEQLMVVCAPDAPWARRRREMTLADLADAPWIQSRAEIAPGGPTHDAFAALGMAVPPIRVISNSLNLRFGLIETGRFVTMIHDSALRLGAPRARIRVLPVTMPPWRFPTVAATLKGRTLPPLAALFLDILRGVVRRLEAKPLRATSAG